ncbi:MAG: M48 metallopeptidase family protein [Candidatus Anammoxibacter sp.]
MVRNGLDKPAHIKQRIRYFAEKMEIEINHLAVRPMSRKWASCSTNGNLPFDKKLVAIEKELGEYVIVHELLHFNTPNHGKLWKSLMTAYLGDWEKPEIRLKKNAVIKPGHLDEINQTAG